MIQGDLASSHVTKVTADISTKLVVNDAVFFWDFLVYRVDSCFEFPVEFLSIYLRFFLICIPWSVPLHTMQPQINYSHNTLNRLIVVLL